MGLDELDDEGETAEAMSNVDELPAFARNVLGFRLHRRLSQQTLADRCGLSRTTIAKIERGHVVPSLATVAKLAIALGTTTARLVDDPRQHGTLTRLLERIKVELRRLTARGRKLLAKFVRQVARLRPTS